ncbi:MAG: tetratricopeptide repeat protein [Pseudomonadota bacterium]|nr:tetratricopeptide repeat protein [Pseudomonadota bacterium]
MSDDSFIREVDEELRQDRIQGLWSRYGWLLIAVAVLIVAGTAAWRGWQYYTEQRAAAAGDAYMSAIELSENGRQEEALAALDALVQEGHGAYPTLARLRVAGELEGEGKQAEALAAYDAIAADNSVDEAFRAVARLRAGLIAVDTESYEAVRNRLEPLAAAGGYYRHLAREGLGLSAWKAGAGEEAQEWFRAIAEDAESGSNIRSRAALMLDLLAGKGVGQAG